MLSISYCNNKIVFNPIDGTFPDWRRVCPAETDGTIAQFNVDYLSDFGAMRKIFGQKTAGLVCVKHNGGSPALIDLGLDDVEYVAVLMPFRDRSTNEGLKPAWA